MPDLHGQSQLILLQALFESGKDGFLLVLLVQVAPVEQFEEEADALVLDQDARQFFILHPVLEEGYHAQSELVVNLVVDDAKTVVNRVCDAQRHLELVLNIQSLARFCRAKRRVLCDTFQGWPSGTLRLSLLDLNLREDQPLDHGVPFRRDQDIQLFLLDASDEQVLLAEVENGERCLVVEIMDGDLESLTEQSSGSALVVPYEVTARAVDLERLEVRQEGPVARDGELDLAYSFLRLLYEVFVILDDGVCSDHCDQVKLALFRARLALLALLIERPCRAVITALEAVLGNVLTVDREVGIFRASSFQLAMANEDRVHGLVHLSHVHFCHEPAAICHQNRLFCHRRCHRVWRSH